MCVVEDDWVEVEVLAVVQVVIVVFSVVIIEVVVDVLVVRAVDQVVDAIETLSSHALDAFSNVHTCIDEVTCHFSEETGRSDDTHKEWHCRQSRASVGDAFIVWS